MRHAKRGTITVAQLARGWSLEGDESTVAEIMSHPGPYTVAEVRKAEKDWDADCKAGGGDPREMTHYPWPHLSATTKRKNGGTK